MKTSARLSADERRQAILDAAFPLFAERGFDAVTTKQIAKAARVSEALLYRHFPSKAALHGALLENCVGEATMQVERLNPLPDSTATLVLCLYAMMWQVQVRMRRDARANQMARLKLRSILTDGAFARLFMVKTSVPWVGKLRRCLMAAIENGDVTGDLAEAELGGWFAYHISSSIVSYALPLRRVIDYGATDQEILEKSVRFSLRGIGMRQEAIDAHFVPGTFNLLLEAAE